MKIFRPILENIGNIVEPQANSSALELKKMHLKQNRAPRAQQTAPQANRTENSHLNKNRIQFHNLLFSIVSHFSNL